MAQPYFDPEVLIMDEPTSDWTRQIRGVRAHLFLTRPRPS
jgi:hypothetical protein